MGPNPAVDSARSALWMPADEAAQLLCTTFGNIPVKIGVTEEKLVNETRIPAGTYRVLLRTAGKHHRQYKSQFPEVTHPVT